MRPPAAARTQPQSETATEFVYALRIAAIAAIVLMNTATRGFTDVVIGSGGWQVLNIFNTLARWAVPVFVMIAGTLMLDPETPTGMRVLFKKHLLRLGVIYGFWSLVYALAAPGGVPQTVGALLEQTLKGPPHFWYIPMLAGLYLITPVLKPFVCRAGKRELEYFLLLCFVLGCGVGLLKGLTLFPPLIEAADALKLPFVFGYTGFYVFGYYSRAYPLGPRVRLTLAVAAFIAAGLTVWGTTALSVRAGETVTVLYANLTPQYALIGAAVFTAAYARWIRRGSQSAHPAVRLIAECAFGIYILHGFALRVFDAVGFGFTARPLWQIPAAAIVVFTVCFCCVYALKHIPVINKYWI